MQTRKETSLWYSIKHTRNSPMVDVFFLSVVSIYVHFIVRLILRPVELYTLRVIFKKLPKVLGDKYAVFCYTLREYLKKETPYKCVGSIAKTLQAASMWIKVTVALFFRCHVCRHMFNIVYIKPHWRGARTIYWVPTSMYFAWVEFDLVSL